MELTKKIFTYESTNYQVFTSPGQFKPHTRQGEHLLLGCGTGCGYHLPKGTSCCA